MHAPYTNMITRHAHGMHRCDAPETMRLMLLVCSPPRSLATNARPSLPRTLAVSIQPATLAATFGLGSASIGEGRPLCAPTVDEAARWCAALSKAAALAAAAAPARLLASPSVLGDEVANAGDDQLQLVVLSASGLPGVLPILHWTRLAHAHAVPRVNDLPCERPACERPAVCTTCRVNDLPCERPPSDRPKESR